MFFDSDAIDVKHWNFVTDWSIHQQSQNEEEFEQYEIPKMIDVA